MFSPLPVLQNGLTASVFPCAYWGMTMGFSGGSRNLLPDIANEGAANGDKQETHFKRTVPF